MSDLSLNQNAMRLVKDLFQRADEYKVEIIENANGAHVVDAGIEAKGGYLAGKRITEICLAGLGDVSLSSMRLGEIGLPSIFVSTDHPAIATLGSQLAGWRIKIGDYSAVASGPARALALKPRSIYEEIGYKDKSDEAILMLETSRKPPGEVVKYISKSCNVSPERLFLILVPTLSLAGFTQISGRIAETGIHKLTELGLDPKLVKYAQGVAPIMPMCPDDIEAMGRTNDAILYGGATYYIIDCGDDQIAENLTKQAVSSASKQYGRPFSQIFSEANLDFYGIDPSIFAPAVMTINNQKTGKTHTAGTINYEILTRSLDK